MWLLHKANGKFILFPGPIEGTGILQLLCLILWCKFVCLFVCFFIKHCPPFMILLVRIQRRNFSITCHHLPQKKGDYLGEYFQRYSKKFSVFLLVLFFSVWKPILINLSTQNQTQNAFSGLSGSQILTASLWIAFHGYILHAFQTALLPQQR